MFLSIIKQYSARSEDTPLVNNKDLFHGENSNKTKREDETIEKKT